MKSLSPDHGKIWLVYPFPNWIIHGSQSNRSLGRVNQSKHQAIPFLSRFSPFGLSFSVLLPISEYRKVSPLFFSLDFCTPVHIDDKNSFLPSCLPSSIHCESQLTTKFKFVQNVIDTFRFFFYMVKWFHHFLLFSSFHPIAYWNFAEKCAAPATNLINRIHYICKCWVQSLGLSAINSRQNDWGFSIFDY